MDPIQNIISKPYFIIPYLMFGRELLCGNQPIKNSYSGL